MNNLSKYIALYVIAVSTLVGLSYAVYQFSTQSIEFQEQILVKQAQTHYFDQINTRKWNASYGGVYAFAKVGEEPNPYLKNNTLKTDDNRTLIKINPAWMTRQLSEISNIKDFHFRITSLKPINPNNKATPFERKALEYIEKTKKTEYYELADNNQFNYMGSLITTKDCLVCHEVQGYKVGDIRGGISVSLDSSEYNQFVTDTKYKSFLTILLILLFLLAITFLVKKQIANNEHLKSEVEKRIKEIKLTQELLQQILDADLSLLIVTDGDNLIFTNKTALDFFRLNSQEEFKNKYTHISDIFEKIDKKDFLQRYMDGQHWIDYLQKEQLVKELKVLIKKDAENRYFRPYVKKISVENEKLYLVIFNEITNHYEKIQQLREKVARDSLTKLFNRSKFDDVLAQAIVLSQTTSSPLSIIFLDIDHFKTVNDTLGHNIGDEVLVEIAEIISSNVREGDFVARWGGEEFIITLQSTDKVQATTLAEKIRIKVEEHNFKSAGKQTISIGVTEYIRDESIDNFTKRVDKALYEAKQSGRNRVAVY
ncbi:MAG: diguanylate cyclase [Sulfurimonas sp.]|jgi:diguanylate cyclase (GGDEF)-like protein